MVVIGSFVVGRIRHDFKDFEFSPGIRGTKKEDLPKSQFAFILGTKKEDLPESQFACVESQFAYPGDKEGGPAGESVRLCGKPIR